MRFRLAVAVSAFVAGSIVAAVTSALAAQIGPSFDCDKASTPLARMICASPELSRIDLQFVQPYYAIRQQLSAEGRRELDEEDHEFIESVQQLCGVPETGPIAGSPDCVGTQYNRKRVEWVGRLSGAAREEANRPIEQHIAVQRALQEKGFLPASAKIDGVYGGATRSAVAAWQTANGRPATGFISNVDATALAAPIPVAAAQAQPSSPATPNPALTAAQPTPLVRAYQSLGPGNPQYICIDPVTPEDANFCLHYMLTQNGLSRPENIEAALGRPLYEKYMALRAEGIRVAQEKQASQIQEANSPRPVLSNKGIPWIAGSVICPDAPTLNLVLDLFEAYDRDQITRRVYTEEQARILYGAPIFKPDPKSYGCVLVPPGTPLTRVRFVVGYPFVRSVDPIDGVQVEGITFPSMVR
jgi:peptidoglycan hydrolase-like protein with peptidoglycan-binding domain